MAKPMEHPSRPDPSDPDPRSGARTDDDLIRSLRSGESEALGVLIERFWHPIVTYAMRRLGRWDDAEDLTQEVFVRVWEGRGSLSHGRSVQGYLYRVASNLLVDRARRDSVRARALPRVESLTRPVRTPVETAVHQELRADFERALAALPDRRREAFELVRVQGLSLKAAAEAMELAPRTVANHVYLAATDLEAALRPHLG